MQSIFNSLGSNYSFSFARTALKQIFSSNRKNIVDLHEYLNKQYEGESFLFYKGRDAIEFSLKVLFSEGQVLTQAFSCYAVEEGIKRAGMTPLYVDVQKNSTNMSVETLQEVFSKSKDAKAVLVQHSLGIPADILAIKKWCLKNNLVLIEDLAQSIGAVDGFGEQLGKNADAIIFSFGRDKIIDAVSGGAVVFKKLSEEQTERIDFIKINDLPVKILVGEMFYPFVTFLGRKTHNILIGKIILKLAVALKLITSPTISKINGITKINPAYAKLALDSFSQLETQIMHRRKIAKHYLDKINNENIEVINTENDIRLGSSLRFSIRTERVDDLIAKMKKYKIYLSDRWYRTPVDCGKHGCNSNYQTGSAINAEKLAKEVLNLPTHQNISLEKADRIIKVINEF